MVYLRFNSLFDFSKIIRGWTEIARQVWVNPVTIKQAVTRYVNNGGLFPPKVEHRGAQRKLNPELESEICSEGKLIEYRFLSLKERIVRIRR